MKWTPQQDAALKSVSDWLQGGDQQVYRLDGYAGTGKTELAKHLAADVEGDVMFMAPTGKAALVMRQRGCVDAGTIHSRIYHTKDQSRAKLKELEAELAEVLLELRTVDLANDTPEYREQAISENVTVKNLRAKIAEEKSVQSQPMFTKNLDSDVKDAALVVVDERSMVGERVGTDLLSFGTKVLALGDPAQLPPVGDQGFLTSNHPPDFTLTDIVRQARDNPIIAMATTVREGGRLELGTYGESAVLERSQITEEDVMAADQILVGRNRTRHASNDRVRQLLGLGDRLLVPSDRLVCLRNNYDFGLLNGAIWHVEDVGELGDERVVATLSSDDDRDTRQQLEMHTHYFLGCEERLGWWERKDAEEFDYGYALTVHKAQGSQFGSVVLFDESWCFRADAWRHLYTALTRAVNDIKVVKM